MFYHIIWILKTSYEFQMINSTINDYAYGTSVTTTLDPSSLELNINNLSSCIASFVNIK